MSFVCTHMSIVCHSCVSRMCSYVIRISLVLCTRMSSVCHLYVLICHPYVTLYHSYVLVYHLHVTRMYSYVIRLCFYHEPLFSNTFLTLRRIRFFCSVFVFRRDTSNAILDLVLYLYSEGLNISWKYTSTIPSHYLYSSQHSIYSTLSLTGSQFIFLKCDASIWDLGGKFRRKRIHLFWAFWSWFSKFFLK